MGGSGVELLQLALENAYSWSRPRRWPSFPCLPSPLQKVFPTRRSFFEHVQSWTNICIITFASLCKVLLRPDIPTSALYRNRRMHFFPSMCKVLLIPVFFFCFLSPVLARFPCSFRAPASRRRMMPEYMRGGNAREAGDTETSACPTVGR